MDDNTLYLVLGALALSSVLNLVLSLRVLTAARVMVSAAEKPFALPAGELVPPLGGRPMLSRASLSFTRGGRPAALVFLSSTCPKCRQKLPELAALLPLLEPAGLDLWLVSREPAWRLKRFLAGSALPARTLRVDLKTLKAVNPTAASPYYAFLDAEGRLEAAGFIGDENWQSFREQMRELEQELGMAA